MRLLYLFIGLIALSNVGFAQRPAVVEPNEVPFVYDVNLAPDLMDWAICEPNLSVIYGARMYSKSGRPARMLEVTEATGVVIDFAVWYEGREKDPNGPGWWHEWQVGYTPRFEGIHYLLLTGRYGRWSYSDAWWIPPGQIPEINKRTILINAVFDDSPYLMPGLTPSPPIARMKDAQRAWQAFAKQGKVLTKPTSVLR